MRWCFTLASDSVPQEDVDYGNVRGSFINFYLFNKTVAAHWVFLPLSCPQSSSRGSCVTGKFTWLQGPKAQTRTVQVTCVSWQIIQVKCYITNKTIKLRQLIICCKQINKFPLKNKKSFRNTITGQRNKERQQQVLDEEEVSVCFGLFYGHWWNLKKTASTITSMYCTDSFYVQ